MLDESMFEDIHEIAENSAYLKAVEERDICLDMLEQLPPVDSPCIIEMEQKLRLENKLTFDSIFNEAIGYYYIKCFLLADYAVDKACFIKDITAYKKMRFESARKKVSKLIYQRFVSTEPQNDISVYNNDTASKKGLSVFQIIQLQKLQQNNMNDAEKKQVNVLEPSNIHTHTKTTHGYNNSTVHTNTTQNGVMSMHNAQSSISTQSPATQVHSTISTNNVHTELYKKEQSMLQMGTQNNSIGVYGQAVKQVQQKVAAGSAPADLFDNVAREVMNDLKLDVYPRFIQSEFYKKYLRTKYIEYVKVNVKDFTTFRVLGRGGFGAVHACRKKNSGTIYAMKCFPAEDTRILTNRGFLFFDQIQAALADVSNPGLLYAAYDIKSQQITYVPGELVIRDGNQHDLVDITPHSEQRRWDIGSDEYGINISEFTDEIERNKYLSLRVTTDHDVYVQTGNHIQSDTEHIAWSKKGWPKQVVAEPAKIPASKLLITCTCVDDCVHKRKCARFTCVAANGISVRSDQQDQLVQHLFTTLNLQPHQIDPFLELYGFWLGDGNLNYARDGHAIIFSQIKTTDLDWLQVKLVACGLIQGIDWSISNVQGKGTRTIRLYNSLWFKIFDAEYGSKYTGSDYYIGIITVKSGKWFWWWVISCCNQQQLRLIVSGLHRADGSFAASVNTIYTSTVQFRDELMVVLYHAGYSAYFVVHHKAGDIMGYNKIGSPGGKVYSAADIVGNESAFRPIQATVDGYKVCYSEPNSLPGKRACWPHIVCTDVRAEVYNGIVWCVTVQHDDHLIIAQRAVRAADGVVKKVSRPVIVGQCINKKLVKVKSALENVLEERNVLTCMNSNFVTNLKYALQDEDSLYLIMDLMLGGDLKFHLINAGRFTEKRARFYAAQVLLGLEQLHANNIVYRDMKLENVLLDHNGSCRISDLGLAVVTKVKIKGYAGTPGYTAPEMIKNKLYGVSADIFSYGVMLYRMLCGSKPFKGKVDRDLDKAVLEKKPQFPKEIFSKDATSLLTGLLQKRPENRLGCSPEHGINEIKSHPFFESIDWGLLEAGYIDPPFVPNKYDVNAASLKDIGDFDRAKYRHVKLDDRFKARIKNFEFTSSKALQDEMVAVLEKADENVNFEKFGAKKVPIVPTPTQQNASCCNIH